jgi:DNA-binding MarR family transcriptional regulator
MDGRRRGVSHGADQGLLDAERAVLDRTAGLDLDHGAMAVISNIFRVSTAIRRHMESTVLAPDGLSWTAFVTLWCLWISGELESRELAAAVGISKPTSTGVVTTLEKRGLVRRSKGTDDGRMVRVALTAAGVRLIEALFPRFNAEESAVAAALDAAMQDCVAAGLRDLLRGLERVRR